MLAIPSHEASYRVATIPYAGASGSTSCRRSLLAARIIVRGSLALAGLVAILSVV
jgi:hypothetical protein